jgi:hypothetical protein
MSASVRVSLKNNQVTYITYVFSLNLVKHMMPLSNERRPSVLVIGLSGPDQADQNTYEARSAGEGLTQMVAEDDVSVMGLGSCR